MPKRYCADIQSHLKFHEITAYVHMHTRYTYTHRMDTILGKIIFSC